MTRHKAVAATIGALVTVLGVLGAAVADGTLTFEELGGVVAAAVTAGGSAYAVWRYPNAPAASK
jgi:multisubunit Na+/H+ antiporter MnhG subunit